jgi:o-succinylbenzoate synthase
VTIRHVEVVPFDLPLWRPLVLAAGTVHRRRGFILRLVSDMGTVGHGEASPAYWLRDEPIERTARVLEQAAALRGCHADHLGPVVAAWRERSCAAACALDTARLDLQARGRGVSAAALLGGRARPMPAAALVTDADPLAVWETVRTLAQRGYGCVKLKVGGGTIDTDAARIAAARRAGGPTLVIRLDANRAWPLHAARRAVATFARYEPALLEEPLASSDAGDWQQLRRESPIPLALDESVGSERDLERFAAAAAFLVIKAVRVGGPEATLSVAAVARRAGMRILVTDAIESSVGRALALHLAATLHEEGTAVGLGGARLLADDPLGHAAAPRAHETPAGPGLGL